MLLKLFFLILYLSLSSVFKFIFKKFDRWLCSSQWLYTELKFCCFKNHIFLKQVSMGSWGYLKKPQHDSHKL